MTGYGYCVAVFLSGKPAKEFKKQEMKSVNLLISKTF